MVSVPEFSHVVKLSEIGGGRQLHLTANDGERTSLAERFGLAALDSLTADIGLKHEASGISATGHLTATLEQNCVATGNPVRAKIDEAIALRFVAESDMPGDAEIELGAEDCDTIFHDGHGIDIGEAIAQSLGLALDPYPRCADADEALKAAGVKAEQEAGPLGALAALKDLLTKS